MTAVLVLDDIHHGYGGTAVLGGISLRLAPGQVLALTGPSGCGKTTLLHIAAGLLTPWSGTVTNDFRRISYVFQEPRLLPWRNTLENLAFGLKARGVPVGKRRQVALELAEQLGLAAAVRKYPHQLSGGMRQRVALGRALAVEPDLLLLDEPFSALDIGRKRELQELMRDLLRTRHVGALFVTHDLTEAARLGNELVVLSSSPARVVARKALAPPPAAQRESFIYETVAALLRQPQVAAAFTPTPEP